MHARHPEIARRWDKKYGGKVKKKKRKRRRRRNPHDVREILSR
jgi:hypothetical protein